MKKPFESLLSAGKRRIGLLTHTQRPWLSALLTAGVAVCLLFSQEAFAQETASAGTSHVVRGVIRDEAGEPLPGATAVVKGNSQKYAIADENGQFTLEVDPRAVLEVSFVGYAAVEYPVNGRSRVEISMSQSANRLKDVVVIGSIERDKESFTGSTTVVSGSQLKQVGATNLVESLKSLDPSFVVLADMAAGANPNVLPTIEVRGQTSINISDVDDMFSADPNQPLFILDGFETTLQEIIDLDFNRVASVTILKDAASTAFYGSRAANGVIVVETISGEPGRYRFYYTGDFQLQMPDLSSYNMMNAEEKLQFELLSGRYNMQGTSTNPINDAYAQLVLDRQYNDRLLEIQKGVNSDWMSEPLQAALTQRHSLRMSGGNKETTVNFGVSYRNAPGVMKGSGRESWTGDLDFTYRKGTFSITNRLGLSGVTGVDSPYGAFQNYVNTNPYYRKTTVDGEYPRYLDYIAPTNPTQSGYNLANPLYNASLNSKSEVSNMAINERVQAQWEFYKGMRLQGQFQLTTRSDETVRFTPPEHTQYDNQVVELQGSYSKSATKGLSYMGNLMYIWANNINKHGYVVNLRGELAHNGATSSAYSAVGFPMGTNGSPSFSLGYPEAGKPSYANVITRRVNFLASLNYAYDNRYLFDATYRLDGSTVFGSAEKFTPFWSTGVGWNLHEEAFVKSGDFSWLTQLRLRASIGQVGNQNIGSTVFTSIYTYTNSSSEFGPGVSLSQLGNAHVKWQKTTSSNLALDINLFNSLLVGRFEVYGKLTNPLVVSVDQAPSSGVSAYPMSLGSLDYQGFEFDLTAALIRSTARSITWRVRLMGSVLDGEFDDFSNKIEGMNKAAQESNSLTRYRDGYNAKTLWALRSLGIDPATGREVFLNRFNQPTFVHDAADVMAVGVGAPDVMGTINSFFTWKQLTLSVVMRYSIGEERFNNALYNKVENISFSNVANNQDKRALLDRWQKPGDISQFKGIWDTSSTPMSSRFIQTENYLSGESIGLMWTFEKDSWIRHIGMERLSFNATATGSYGIFRLSNIQYERGTDYPEAYTVSLSINAAF